MNHTTDKQFLGTKESARFVGVSYSRFRKMVAAGAIRPVAGTKTYRKTDLRRLIEGSGKDGHIDATR